MPERRNLEALMALVEEMWGHQDTLLQIIDDTGQWDHKHGPDWTFADVPYHLMYCNRDLIARPLKLGRELPIDHRVSIANVEELNAWNEEQFDARPAAQTGHDSLAQLRASWNEIRRIVADWTDNDLQAPWWMPFLGGMWLTARDGLQWSLTHDWSEFMQLRIHMGRKEPVPSPVITTHVIATVLGGMYPQMFNAAAAQGRELTAVFAFTDPGVSSFTMVIADQHLRVAPGDDPRADLLITQSAETFEATRTGILSLPEAVQKGGVQVNDMEALAAFREMFGV